MVVHRTSLGRHADLRADQRHFPEQMCVSLAAERVQSTAPPRLHAELPAPPDRSGLDAFAAACLRPALPS